MSRLVGTSHFRIILVTVYWMLPGQRFNTKSVWVLGEDVMLGDTDKYLGPQDLRELGDDSLPQEGYVGFSIGARSGR